MGDCYSTQVGNAVTDGRQIVVGMGSSMLINAALYAFSNASRTPGGTPPLHPAYHMHPGLASQTVYSICHDTRVYTSADAGKKQAHALHATCTYHVLDAPHRCTAASHNTCNAGVKAWS